MIYERYLEYIGESVKIINNLILFTDIFLLSDCCSRAILLCNLRFFLIIIVVHLPPRIVEEITYIIILFNEILLLKYVYVTKKFHVY